MLKKKSTVTQAGEFVQKVFQEIKKRRLGARTTKEVLAVTLSEARRAGVNIPSALKRFIAKELPVVRSRAVKVKAKSKKVKGKASAHRVTKPSQTRQPRLH